MRDNQLHKKVAERYEANNGYVHIFLGKEIDLRKIETFKEAEELIKRGFPFLTKKGEGQKKTAPAAEGSK